MLIIRSPHKEHGIPLMLSQGSLDVEACSVLFLGVEAGQKTGAQQRRASCNP